MATTKTSVNPVQTGITTDERVYATRYKQGGRTVFGLSLTPAQLVSMVARPDPQVPNPGNRAIRENHARQFAEYYLNHADWVSPALILRAPSIFKFESFVDDASAPAPWGVLSYPKRQASSIQILDGQHRTLGFHIALAMIQQRIEKARDQHRRAIVSEGDKNSAVVREAARVLKEAEALMDRFDSEQVSIEIQVTDNLAQYRQMFYDIAENAIGITASVKARFDTRKVANRALPLVLENPFLNNRVDMENDRLPRTSPNWAAARHIADIVRAAYVGVDGRFNKKLEKTASERGVADTANAFFALAVNAFPQLKALQDGQITAAHLREISLLGSPAMLRALAGVYHGLLSDQHGWDRDMVLAFFKALNPHMAGGAHANSIWMRIEMEANGNKQKAFTEGYFSPNGRRQDIAAIEKTLIAWGVLGKQGAPWVWEEPAAPPAAPKTEDELILEAEIAADPELGELLAAQLEMEKTPPRKRA